MVILEARVLGRPKPLIPEWSVPLPPRPEGEGSGDLTLRTLLERIVRAQVAAYEGRQEAQQFVRVLTQREIDRGASQGRIDPGGRERAAPVDVEMAIAVAIQAFEDRMYLVLIDGQEQKDLDETVRVEESSRVMFVRLTFLAGA